MSRGYALDRYIFRFDTFLKNTIAFSTDGKNIRIRDGSFFQNFTFLALFLFPFIISSLFFLPYISSLLSSVLCPTDITSSSVAISTASVFTQSIGHAIEIVALSTAMCYCNGPRLDPLRTDLLAVFSCKKKPWGLFFIPLCIYFLFCYTWIFHSRVFSGQTILNFDLVSVLLFSRYPAHMNMHV